MTKQSYPYFSARASGTLIPGLTTRNTRGQPHLIRQAIPQKPRSPAQKTNAEFLLALAQAWTYNHVIAEPTWKTVAEDPKQDAYHNYVSYNMKRKAMNLWPTLKYPEDPASTANNADSPSTIIYERAFSITANPHTSTPIAFIAYNISLAYTSSVEPKTATNWRWGRTTWSQALLFKVPAAPFYFFTMILVNHYGKAGTSKNWGAGPIPD